MGEHPGREHFHIVRQRVVAAAENGVSLGRSIERLRTARTDTEQKIFIVARALYDGEHVIDDGGIDGDARDGFLQVREIDAAENAGSCFAVMAAGLTNDLALTFGNRDSQCGGASESDRAAIRAEGTRHGVRPDSAWRSP